MRMGVDAFVDRAAAAGVDGVLLLDLPIEESRDMHERLTARGIDQIFLVSPTTTDARLRVAGRAGPRVPLRDFATGRDRRSRAGRRRRPRRWWRGFGGVCSCPWPWASASRAPSTCAKCLGYADAAVVGSAIVQVIAAAAASGADVAEAVERFVRWLKGGAEAAMTCREGQHSVADRAIRARRARRAGLLGGSLAMAVRRAWPRRAVIGTSSRSGPLPELAMVDRTRPTVADLACDSDLVVLAEPVDGDARGHGRDRRLRLDAVVTDMGSTKRT